MVSWMPGSEWSKENIGMDKETKTKIHLFFRRLFKRKLVMLAAILVLFFILTAIFAPLLTPYEPNKQDLTAILQKPSASHWLGTDEAGRDVLSRIFYGARTSLIIGVVSVLSCGRSYFGLSISLLWRAAQYCHIQVHRCTYVTSFTDAGIGTGTCFRAQYRKPDDNPGYFHDSNLYQNDERPGFVSEESGLHNSRARCRGQEQQDFDLTHTAELFLTYSGTADFQYWYDDPGRIISEFFRNGN